MFGQHRVPVTHCTSAPTSTPRKIMNKLFVRSENWGSAALLAIPVAIAALLVCGGSGSFVWVAALTIVAISIALDAGRRMSIVRLRTRVAADYDTTWALREFTASRADKILHRRITLQGHDSHGLPRQL
jgi:hypothetical protein